MFIHGVITDIPTPEEHAERVDKQRAQGRGAGMVGLGIKKRTSGKPTFFRVAFFNEEGDDLADWIVRNYSLRDPVCIEVSDDSVRLVWEVDDKSRTSAVIRANGISIAEWDGLVDKSVPVSPEHAHQ